ncbi:MAG: hypothetical protein WCA32_20840 [Chromatiaceae bacterium]|jgi:hypothetical protein
MAEAKFRLKKAPKVRDAIELYGFICPILKMLPFDVYLRVEIADTGLILETEKHYFDDIYNLSSKTGSAVFDEMGTDYVSSVTGSRSYPIDAGSMYKSKKQLEDDGFLRKIAKNVFMSRYSKSTVFMKNSFDSDIKWEDDEDGGAILVMTSSSEGDYRRLEKRLVQQFLMDEVRISEHI